MKILLAGLGSIGSRHLENLRALDPECEAVVLRRRESPEATDGVTVRSLDEALEHRPEVALVCGPASTHLETALELARAGVHLFIEKPLSRSLEGVRELEEVCRGKGLVVMIGYNLRFHPPLALVRKALDQGRIGELLYLRTEAGQYLPDWRPGRDYRDTVSVSRKLGGGVLLELSHEIDLARWLGGPVTALFARLDRLGSFDMEVEDAAELLLVFPGNRRGHVHVDMLQRTPRRQVLAVGGEGTLEWDMETDRVRLYSVETGGWEELRPPGPEDRNRMYMDELAHFLGCVRTGASPAVGIAEGIETLRIVEASRQSARTGVMVEL